MKRYAVLVTHTFTIFVGIMILTLFLQLLPASNMHFELNRVLFAKEHRGKQPALANDSESNSTSSLEASYCYNQLTRNISDDAPTVKRLAAQLQIYANYTDAILGCRSTLPASSFQNLVKLQSNLERELFPFLLNKTALQWRNHWKAGRGLAFALSSNFMKFALILIENLKLLNSTLPIEAFHIGSELQQSDKQRMETLGVKVIDILTLMNNDQASINGFAIKPFTLFYSSYRETILVDADTLFFYKPEILFDEPGYKQTGTLFYLDRFYHIGEAHSTGPVWFDKNMPEPISERLRSTQIYRGLSNNLIEAGVVVYDKYRNLYGTLAACRLQAKKDRDGWYAKAFWGDKEAFWLGMELLNQTYAIHSSRPGVIGWLNRSPNSGKMEACGNVMHPGNDKRPFWWNGGVIAKFSGDVKVNFEAFAIEKDYDTSRRMESCLEAVDPIMLDARELNLIKKLQLRW